MSWAPAFNALASLDMQDQLRFAVPAKHRESISDGFGIDAQQPLVSAAHWAGDPSVHYGHFSTVGAFLQERSLHFCEICELFN